MLGLVFVLSIGFLFLIIVLVNIYNALNRIAFGINEHVKIGNDVIELHKQIIKNQSARQPD